MYLLRLDIEHFGSPNWNPFSSFIRPGDYVLIKPNLVTDDADITCTVTHASIIRVLIDYVWIALKGKGKIVVGDAPQENADFNRIIRVTGLRALQKYYKSKGIGIELADLRSFVSDRKFVWRKKRDLPCRIIDLGERSYLNDLSKDSNRFYGAYWNRREVRIYHSPGKHRYMVPQSVLDADVIIMVPKMKTHKKQESH